MKISACEKLLAAAVSTLALYAYGGGFIKARSFSSCTEFVSAPCWTSSGAVYNTGPVCWNDASWFFDFGEYGFVDGYFGFISSFDRKKGDDYRLLFNEIEATLCYGRKLAIAEDVTLDCKAGVLWGPPIGYKNAHQGYWGPYVGMTLANPVVEPYMTGLWIMEPGQRGYVRFGLRKPFSVAERTTLTPFMESVWMDRRRYINRYGAEPRHDYLGGGLFATLKTGATVSYRMDEHLSLYFTCLMFDVIDSQARRYVRNINGHYAKCDCPVLAVGAVYRF
jgi:hypothetical protein